MDTQTAIDKIKELTRKQESSHSIELQAGDNVGISKSGKGYVVSATFPEQDPISSSIAQVLPKYTIQICVDGTPKSLDVYVAKMPY
jgi:hypothetical protein